MRPVSARIAVSSGLFRASMKASTAPGLVDVVVVFVAHIRKRRATPARARDKKFPRRYSTMAGYETIPKEDAPLQPPKHKSPKFAATVAAICLASAVAGTQAPSAIVGAELSTARRPAPKQERGPLHRQRERTKAVLIDPPRARVHCT